MRRTARSLTGCCSSLTSIAVLGFATVAGFNAANEAFQDAAYEVHGLLVQHGLVSA